MCEKDYTDIFNQPYTLSLFGQVAGAFEVKQGDSIRYAIFQEKKHSGTFTIFDSQAGQVLSTEVEAAVVAGRVTPVRAEKYFFTLKTKSLPPNPYIVTIQKKNCTYVKKAVPPKPAPPVYVVDTTITVKFDSTIYLASRLNMKNQQRLVIPIDSLQGVVTFEINTEGGAITYRFLNQKNRVMAQGKGAENSGQLPKDQPMYNLLLENEDQVAGRHVKINITQTVYRSTLQQPQ